MPLRRHHTKSRHGCVECKARKVKCDETQPACGRCVQRNNRCHYKQALSHVSATPPPSVNIPFREQTHLSIPRDYWNNVFPHLAHSPSGSEQATTDNFRERDLELLHQYSTFTYRTLADGPTLESFWQLTIPKIAFSHTFLMHGLLALSACDLARLQPEAAEHYCNLAIRHQTAAISLFRPLLDNINNATAVPTVAFSCVIGCVSFAMPQELLHPQVLHAPGSEFVKHILDIFRLMRGIKNVLADGWKWVKDSDISPLLTIDLENAEVPLEFNAETAVRELEAKIQSDASTRVTQIDCLEAVTTFRQCFPRSTEGHHQTIVSAWPVMIRDDFFLEMLEMKVGLPLVILGYYGVLMHLTKSTWWINDKGKRLVEGVSAMLTPELRHLMIWPRMRVGASVLNTIDSALGPCTSKANTM